MTQERWNLFLKYYNDGEDYIRMPGIDCPTDELIEYIMRLHDVVPLEKRFQPELTEFQNEV